MSRPNGLRLAGLFLVFALILGGLPFIGDGLYIGRHELDTLHLMQIVLRMEDGQIPHLDFMTPIGAFAFAPIVAFLELGLPFGEAFLWSQVLVGAILLPIAFWVAMTRLGPLPAILLGLIVATLSMAIVDGGDDRTISLSMHYNRWAWAAGFLVVLLAIVKPIHREEPVIDGILGGALMYALVMIKVTYFVALAPAVIFALVMTGQVRALIWALATGLAAAAITTFWTGLEFWIAYLDDLLTVALSDVRPAPGVDFGVILSGPQYKGPTLLALLSFILLRQAGKNREAFTLVLLVPGLMYITYQNFGNDSQWLMLLGLYLLIFRPAEGEVNEWGWPLRQAVTICAAVAFALTLPSFNNMAFSSQRHVGIEREDYIPLLVSGGPRGIDTDLRVEDVRALQVNAEIPFDKPGDPFAAYREFAERDEPVVFMGEQRPECTIQIGMRAFFEAIVEDLEDRGYGGASLFAADLFNSYWLYGDFRPLQDGAPWYYGNLAGYEDADYLLVPACPLVNGVSGEILTAIEEGPGTADLREVERNDLYTLYEKG